MSENTNSTGITGIEVAPPIVLELKCSCGKVCGTLTWPASTQVDLEKAAAEHVTVCDDCQSKK